VLGASNFELFGRTSTWFRQSTKYKDLSTKNPLSPLYDLASLP